MEVRGILSYTAVVMDIGPKLLYGLCTDSSQYGAVKPKVQQLYTLVSHHIVTENTKDKCNNNDNNNDNNKT